MTLIRKHFPWIMSAGICLAAGAANGAEQTFTNANGDGDLANPVNWGLENWNTSDSGTLSSATALPNDTKISADWTVATLYYNSGLVTAKTCILNLCGHTLNATRVNVRHGAGSNSCVLCITNGTAIVSGSINTVANTSSQGFRFLDGANVTVNGVAFAGASGNTSSQFIQVMKGATLTFSGTGYLLSEGGTAHPNSSFTIDGGVVNASKMAGLIYSNNNGKNPHFTVKNGGQFHGNPNNVFTIFAASKPTVCITGGATVGFGKGMSFENVGNGSMAVTNSTVVSGTSGISTVTSRNRFVFSGSVVTGKVSLAAAYNTLYITNCTHVGALSLSGKTNTAEVVNCASSGGVSFGANCDANTVVLSGGSRTASGDNAISFGANATNAMLVIDNMTFTLAGQFNADKSSDGGAWTGRPGSAIEFRGAAPSLCVTGSATTDADWISGTMTDVDLDDPVKIRYVLTETPYASAPLYHDNAGFSTSHHLQLGCNTVFEFDLTNLARQRGLQLIPIVHSESTGDHSMREWLDLGGLNKRMSVTGTQSTDSPKLSLSGDGRTLYLAVRGTASGMFIIVR